MPWHRATPFGLAPAPAGKAGGSEKNVSKRGQNQAHGVHDMAQTIIVGLGNPGRQYRHSRHNIGFLVVDRLAAAVDIPFTRQRCLARVGDGEISGRVVLLAKPQTFMNRSGESVLRLLERYHVAPEGLIVVHDDLDLEEGCIKLKGGGGHGGHNGLRSIMDCCGTGAFIRVRVGIGRPVEGMEAATYVLKDFPSPLAVRKITSRAAEMIEYLLLNDLPTAMNRFHSKQ